MTETKSGVSLPEHTPCRADGDAMPVTATSGILSWEDLTPREPILCYDQECSPKPEKEGFIFPIFLAFLLLPGVSKSPGGLVITHYVLLTSDYHPSSMWVDTNGALPPSHMQTCTLASVSKIEYPPWGAAQTGVLERAPTTGRILRAS